MSDSQAAADLAFIRQLMDRSRRVTVLGGHYFIVWGLLVEAALLFTWLAATGRTGWSPLWAWGGAVVLGWSYTIWAGGRDRRLAGAESRSGFLIGRVWMALGIAMSLVFFVGGPLGTLPWNAAPGLAATFIGAAVMLHGTLAGIGWLRNLAAGWWIAAAAMLAWPGLHALLVYALAILLLYVVPGFVLNAERSRMLAGAAR